MRQRWVRRAGVVACTLGLGLAMVAGPAFAASNPGTSSGGTTVTTQMVMNLSGTSSQTLPQFTGNCGSARLTMFQNGPGKLEANYALTSTQGNIVWENVTVALNNGQSDNYDGAGPVLSAKASGQFSFSGLKSKTNYEGTLTGSVTLDSGNTCTIIPTSTTAMTS